MQAKYTQMSGAAEYEYHNANEYKAGTQAFMQVSLLSRDLMAEDNAHFMLESTNNIEGFNYQVCGACRYIHPCTN